MQTKRKIFVNVSISLILMVVTSCTNEGINVVALDRTYAITLPPGISFDTSKRKGIDSYLFELNGRSGFHLQGEIGSHFNRVFDEQPIVLNSKLEDSIRARMGAYFDSTLTFFSDSPEIDAKQNIFSKNFFSYDTVNKIKVKFIQPKIIGDGVTGIIVWDKSKNLYMSLFGENLTAKNHSLALQVFKSLSKVQREDH